ncbi:MAG: MFS transporter [Firmicutes bacterium]|nr:MFS transporter [Bacillota bacterium]
MLQNSSQKQAIHGIAAVAGIYFVLILTFLARSDSAMMQSNNPLFAHELGANLKEVALTATVYALTTLVARFVISMRVQMQNVPRVMWIGFSLWSLSLVGVLLSHQLWMFYVSIAVSGMATALIMPHLLSLMSALSDPEHRERNLSYYSLALSSSLVVAPVVGTVILTKLPLRSVYVFLLIFALIGWIVLSIAFKSLTRAVQVQEKHPPQGQLAMLKSLGGNRFYMNSFWALFLFNISFAVAMTYGGLHVKTAFHLPYSGVELVLTSFFVASLLGRLYVSRRAKQKRLQYKATWIFWSLAVGAVGLALMGWSANLWVFAMGFWLLAWPHAVIFPLVSMRIAGNLPRAQLVAGNTLAQSSFDLSSAFGPALISLVIGPGQIDLGFWIIAGIQLVGMGVFWHEYRQETRLAAA